MPGSVIPHNRNVAQYNVITANGTYLQIARAVPIGSTSGSIIQYFDTLDDVSYLFQTDSGVSAGTITFQILTLDGNWINAPASTVITLTASQTFSNNLAALGLCPALGFRVVVASLAGGNIARAQIISRVS